MNVTLWLDPRALNKEVLYGEKIEKLISRTELAGWIPLVASEAAVAQQAAGAQPVAWRSVKGSAWDFYPYPDDPNGKTEGEWVPLFDRSPSRSPAREDWQPITKPFSLPKDQPFVVMNSAGYFGCATFVDENGEAYYGTPEETTSITSDVIAWAPLPWADAVCGLLNR